MNRSKPSPEPEHILHGSLIFFTLIGLGIRLSAAVQAQFPLNDGGLFYEMISDLVANGFVLPGFVSYNAADLPFAYPPLAFYLTGFLGALLRVSTLDLVRILPPLISTLTIPAFYLLAREISSSKIQIVLGLFAFTLLPRDFAWLIMGGGITRSFGMLFAILAMTFAYRTYLRGARKDILACILFGTLTVITHPEATVHTAITALVFYLWKDRSLKGFLYSLGIAAAILVLSAPWWGVVFHHHGIDPFLAARSASGQDSVNPLVGLFLFFRFMFTDEAFLPLLSVFGLVGLFTSLARKESLLPAWIFILHLIEPRGGPLYMMLPLSLLIASGLEMILHQLAKLSNAEPPEKSLQEVLEHFLNTGVTRYFFLFLFAYCLMSAYTTTQKIKNEFTLQSSDLAAFSWVRENTDQDSQFVLVTTQLPFRDAWSEWFPVIAERRSQATVFGYEWVNDGQFARRVDAYQELQACAHQDGACLEDWSRDFNSDFSYVLIVNKNDPTRYPLTIYLSQNPAYEQVFDNEQTIIFHRDR